MRNLFLVLIVAAAIFLRFWNLGSNPPSLTWDEAAWGYNAYSLGFDGKDEFGKLLPITYLESFGDFKPPLYAYLDILPVKALGLNEFSTRFPSAFFGVATVILTFLLVKKIFDHSEADKISLTAAALLAISPWHILLSRAAFEANVASFFIVFGVYLFLYSQEKYKWLIILSVISFTLSMYTFNTARIVSPLLLIGFLLVKRKNIWINMRKEFLMSVVVGAIIFAPLFLFLMTPQARLRYNEVNIFSDAGTVKTANQEIKNDNNAAFSKIIHNRRLLYAVDYIKHYFDNLNPQFLFIKGDGNPKFSIQDVGQMYVWEIPFFVAGILFLFKKRDKNWWVIPYWFVIGIIPAATARETPHALRIEAVLPTVQILTAYGIIFCFEKIPLLYHGIQLRKLLAITIVLVAIFNFIYFYHNYTVFYPKEFSGEWQYGYKDAISYVDSVKNSYNKIVFTKDLGRPYIYFLFYEKYNPKLFRKNSDVRREALGFVHVNSFDKYVFTKDVSTIALGGNNLYIDVPGNIPQNAKILKTFNLLNGKPSLVAYVR